MSVSAILNREMLDALAERWAGIGAPISRTLRPGLSADEMQAKAAGYGLVLPPELLTWWGWHDGAGLITTPSDREIAPEREFLSLDEAIAQTRENREIVDDTSDPDELLEAWQPSWICLTADQYPVVVDTARSLGEASPTYIYSFEDPPGEGAPRLESLGALVRNWIDVFDAGGWKWDREGERWEFHRDRYPVPIAELGLI